MASTPEPLTQEQQQFLSITHNITTFGSLFALIAFFIRVWVFPAKKISFSLKLIHNLFFADLIYSISNLLSNFSENHPYICNLEGVLRIFSLRSSVIWAVLIANAAYMMTVRNNLQIERRYPKMLWIGYFIPFIVSLLPLLSAVPVSIGYNGAFCIPIYNKTDTNNKYATMIVQFATVLGWAWVGFAFMTFYYIRIFKYVRGLGFNSKTVEVKRLLIFPILLFLAFLFVSVDDLMIFPQWHFELLVLVSLSLHGLGLFNVIAYGFQTIRSSKNHYYDSAHESMYQDFDDESHLRRKTLFLDTLDSEIDESKDRTRSITSNDGLRIGLNISKGY